VYLAFRLAVEDTLSDIELQQDLDDDQDFPLGFLTEVPILEQVPLHVQVDLLAETWNRHRQNQLIEASLLDAAVVFAAFLFRREFGFRFPSWMSMVRVPSPAPCETRCQHLTAGFFV